MKLYRKLATAINAYYTCKLRGNTEWETRWWETIDELAYDHLPSGSGIDSGCSVDLEASSGQKLVIKTAFHHMDQWGGYDGWTEHRVTVLPCLMWGFMLKVEGEDRNGIQDYLAELIQEHLEREVEQ